MIVRHNLGFKSLSEKEEHDAIISKGYIHFVKSGYTTYYSKNLFEAEYIAIRMGGDVQTEEKEVEQCSRCKDYKNQDDIWESTSDVEIIERDLENGIIGNVSLGMCPECRGKYYGENGLEAV